MITSLYNYILKNIIAPPFCRACQIFLNQERVLCMPCEKKINPVVSTELKITEKYACTVFAIGAYEHPLKQLILAKSWADRSASCQLGQLVWEKTYLKHQEFDYIVPIPLHWTRFSYRGYNQAETIARVIAHKSGKPLLHALKRTKRTPFQSAVCADQRVHNVRNVFTLDHVYKNELKNKKILLVDDLMTTGATIKSAARELIKVQPASINAVVVCRTT